MSTPAPSTFKKDLAAAYCATGAKVLSWAVVAGVAFRMHGVEVLAVLALARGTIGLLNYVTLGIGPAMVHMLARTNVPQKVVPVIEPTELPASTVLDYARPKLEKPVVHVDPFSQLYADGLKAGFLMWIVGAILIQMYSAYFTSFHDVPKFLQREQLSYFVVGLGAGLLARLLGDVPGAVLQVRGKQALDQCLVALGDVAWVALLGLVLWVNDTGPPTDFIATVGRCYFASGVLALILRVTAAAFYTKGILHATTSGRRMNQLLVYGSVLTFAQLADFLYAPTDMILINRLIHPDAVAIYTPAVQIDAALLLGISGLATVLLPRAAVAYAAGNVQRLRHDYVRGTLVSAGLLLVGALLLWALSPWLLNVWFGDPMPATQAILPLVLVHTVVGGSSAVGRSILLGMGRVKPYAVVALIAGVSNVVLSYVFVRFFDMGLNGIVLGTIVVVVARCAVWMPWYTMRALGQSRASLPT